jgi:hypothetical protein
MRKLIFIVLVAIFWAGPARAAGGSCPAGVPSGITKCYFVDFSQGSDSNTGTDESHPLKHAVGMQGCVGICGSMSVTGGVGVIFKGGVTWDYTIWPWAPAKSGTDGADLFGGCTGPGCIYYGVDRNWFTGTSWSRPIFSAGGWSNPGTNTACFKDTSASGGTFLSLSYTKFIIVDNFEFTGMCSSTGANGKTYYIQNSNGSGGGNFTVENCYFHGVRFPASAPPSHGDYWAAIGTFDGTLHFTHNVVDGTDAGPTSNYTAGSQNRFTGEGIYAGTVYVDHNVFRNLTQALDIVPVSVNNNLFSNAAASSAQTNVHSHIANDNGCTSPQTTIFNNVVDTIVSGQGWQPGGSNCSVYFFDNVWSNSVMSQVGGRLLNVGPPNNTFYFFNNTMECSQDGEPASGSCGHFNQATFYVFNSHFIGGAVDCGQGVSACASWVTSMGTTLQASFSLIPGSPADIIYQSQSSANGQGYTYSQQYRFSPTSASRATVGTGVNQTAICDTIIDSNAKAECKQDTTYAVAYDQINHAVMPSGRVPNQRLATGAWDVGAYQYGTSSGGGGGSVQPPSGLAAAVN